MIAGEAESLQLLGIDAAVNPANTELATVRRLHNKWRIDSLATGRKQTAIARQLSSQLDPSD